jgi:hypothetical protein
MDFKNIDVDLLNAAFDGDNDEISQLLQSSNVELFEATKTGDSISISRLLNFSIVDINYKHGIVWILFDLIFEF